MSTETVDPAAALRERFRALVAAAATDDEARELADQFRAWARRQRAARWEPYPWQHPHVHPPGWTSSRAPRLSLDAPPGVGVCDERCLLLPTVTPGVHEAWLQRGGRGTGKTEGAAHYINTHVEGPACDARVPGGHRLTIVAPTQADAVTSCITGVTGLQAVNPAVTVTTTKEGTLARWPSGAVARLVGSHSAQDVERCRAWTNVCCAWVEEAAACNWLGGLADEGEPEGTIDQLLFTLRLGLRPHMIVTTTPKNRREVTRLIDRSPIQTWGRTEDAHRLPDVLRESYETRFRGSSLGAQELDGDLVGNVEGALWVMRRPDPVPVDYDDDRPGIDNHRVPVGTVTWSPHIDAPVYAIPPDTPGAVPLDKTVVAVDPPGGRTEAGIVGVGVIGANGYAIADASIAAGPDVWGRRAVQLYLDLGAVGIALERTYGGDMTDHVIETAAAAMGVPTPPIFRAPTKVGKALRADTVVALSQQGRIRHVGYLPGVEDEQTTWIPGQTTDSPNRLDAYVHAFNHLMVRVRTATTARPRGRRVSSTSSAWGGGRTQR